MGTSFLESIVVSEADLMFVGEDLRLGGGVGMGIREVDCELKARLDAAPRSMTDDGTLKVIIEKWAVSSTF